MKKLSILILFSLLFIKVNGQNNVINNVKVEASKAIKVGTTKAIRDLPAAATMPSHKKSKVKETKKKPQNFIGRKSGAKLVHKELEHQGPDRVRQNGPSVAGFDVEPIVNVPGIDIGSSPHDPTGDIGKDYYVQGINVTEIGVFDKQGTLISRFAANTLWEPLGFSSAGDPIVLYDQEYERWFITEFPDPNELLIAVSTTSDPLGAYDVYNFSTPQFPDYPKYALWGDFLTVTTNEGGSNNLTIYALDRRALIAGEDSARFQRLSVPGNTNTEAGFFVATPVDWTGATLPTEGTGPYFLRLNDSSWGEASQDQIELYEAHIDLDNENNTTFTNTSIVTAPYDSNPCAASGFFFSCIPQPGDIGLDGIPEVIMNQAHYRNFGSHESMVFNFITDATDGENISGIRWVELRKTSGTEWQLFQEGTFAPDDGLHRFMGGICMDGSGNIGLAYNVSSDTEFAGIRFTGRRAGDPLGEMTINEYTVIDGQNEINSFSRFGDYAQMGIDPVNDRTFWYTTEYADGGNGASATRIIAFEIKKDTNDLSLSAIISPINSSSLQEEVVSVKITNVGINAQDSFSVGYVFENGTLELDTVKLRLEPDSSYIHTFSQTIQFDSIRDYKLLAYVDLQVDDFRANDTLLATITKYPELDLEVESLIASSTLNCTGEEVFELTFVNKGTITIDSIQINTKLNGVDLPILFFKSPFLFNEKSVLDITVDALVNGTNIVEVEAVILGMNEPIILNNSISSSIEFDSSSLEFTLNLTTDYYPDETYWTLVSEAGNEIANGGGYREVNGVYQSKFCLNADSCYEFTIFDVFGDGLEGDGPQTEGYYEIINDKDVVIASLIDVDFGYEETQEFCGIEPCNLQANITLSSETETGSGDGIIMITTSNGVGPFSYSIDGGQTFQASNLFIDLSSDSYDIVVQGAEDCLFEMTIELSVCMLEGLISVTKATSAAEEDGRIVVTALNGRPPYQYSIDGGDTYQTVRIFSKLAVGNYVISIKDAYNCVYLDTVMVDFTSSTANESYGQVVKVAPNPTDGLFSIEVLGYQSSKMKLFASIYDMNGKRVRESSLYKYNEDYKGEFSITALPAGTYLVKIDDPSFNKIYKVVKL